MLNFDTFHMFVFLQNWMDNMLTWNPRKYGGINVVRLPYNDIWLPDILLYDKYVKVLNDWLIDWLEFFVFLTVFLAI